MGSDALHKVDFIDMSKVASGSVSDKEDCRICDLKAEFNRQIRSSSAVIFVVGDKTGSRTAGRECERATNPYNLCYCTPYKCNVSRKKICKVYSTLDSIEDYGNINNGSYLKHEFMQAEKIEVIGLLKSVASKSTEIITANPMIDFLEKAKDYL